MKAKLETWETWFDDLAQRDQADRFGEVLCHRQGHPAATVERHHHGYSAGCSGARRPRILLRTVANSS